jgi:hypothetical protein
MADSVEKLKIELTAKHLGATQRNSSRNATIAESGHDVGFGGTGKARLGQPCRQCVEGGFVHSDII